MPEIVFSLLIATPAILAGVATLLAWRRVTRPYLFLAFAFLSLLGIQAITAPGTLGILFPLDGALSAALAQQAFVRGLVAAAALQVLLRCPLLWWLYRGLQKGMPPYHQASTDRLQS